MPSDYERGCRDGLLVAAEYLDRLAAEARAGGVVEKEARAHALNDAEREGLRAVVEHGAALLAATAARMREVVAGANAADRRRAGPFGGLN